MNTNMMELNLNEMEKVIGGGDTLDHVCGAVTGATVGMMVGTEIGSIAGAPGCVVGLIAGGVGGGVAGGYFGISKIKNRVKEHLPNPNR